MPPVRFGIIACSSVARRRFLPALGASTTARLERVGSRDAAKAERFAREFSCAKHGDYESVLNDPEVDAVYVSTPPSLHEEWVLRALDSGKHVLCEKPAFPTFAAASEAGKRSRANGVRLMEGYVFKFHPQHATVRSLIEQGRIGKPRFFQAEFTYPRPPEDDIRLNPALEGGVFRDSAGYPVAAALLQMPGEPEAVFCQLGFDSAAGVDNALCLWMRFTSGETAQMLVAFGAQYRSRYAIVGTQGRIELERAFAVPPQSNAIIALETDAGVEKISVGAVDQFRLMADGFAAQISGAEPRKDFETDLLRQHAVMDAAARSHREKRMVDLSEYRL